jgi:hypothetical protein
MLNHNLGVGKVVIYLNIIERCFEGIHLRCQSRDAVEEYDAGVQGEVSAIATAEFAGVIRDQRPILPFDDTYQFRVSRTQQPEVPHRHCFKTASASGGYEIVRKVLVDQKTGGRHRLVMPAG